MSFPHLPGGLARRLLLRVLLFSLCFTVLAGAVQLYFEYRREMRDIEARLELIRVGYLASFERSLWDLNQEQLNVQLHGLVDFPDIARASLRSADFNLVQGDARGRGPLRVERFPLSYQPPQGERRQLGELEIAIDLGAVYRRLWQGGLASLLWMGVFLCGLAVALSWLFHSLVTRHLRVMADFVRSIAGGDLQAPLRLDKRERAEQDEIDTVAHALDDMRQAIRADLRRREADRAALQSKRDELQRRVERRTASLRRAKEEAEAANRAKTRFLATMSHEIRTPLNGILGMAELLRGAPLGEQDRRRLHALSQAGEGLLAILNEVLSFAKLEDGASQPEPLDFSLRQLLDDVLTLLEPRAEENGTCLRLHIDPQVQDACRGAEQFLRQVLSNLVANAVKFTEDGEVRLEVGLLAQEENGQRLRFAVIDDGIGIPAAALAKIFQRFTQASEEVARRYGGTGLGLAISKRLVEAMGGEIGVDSREGEGSTFWFEIVLAPASAPLACIPSEAPGKALDILLVEDVALNREVAQGLLERDGHRVSLAEDAEPALALCRERRFELILLDMHLPGLGGIELCQAIRAQVDGRNRDTPILAFTANVLPGMVRRYYAAGMQGVLGKPLRLPELRRALAGLHDAVPFTEDGPLDLQVLATHRQLLGEHRLAELLASLRGMLDEQLPLLDEALQHDDPQEVADLAHRLAGSCQSMGLRALGECLRELESAALAGEELAGWAERVAACREEAMRELDS
ncbi:Sensor histidine kinase RcsC [compost metagenome]